MSARSEREALDRDRNRGLVSEAEFLNKIKDIRDRCDHEWIYRTEPIDWKYDTKTGGTITRRFCPECGKWEEVRR